MVRTVQPFLNQTSVGLYSITAYELVVYSEWFQYDPEQLLHLSVGRLSDRNFLGEWYFNESGVFEISLINQSDSMNTFLCEWSGPPSDYDSEISGYSDSYLAYAGTFNLLSFPFQNGTASDMTNLSVQQSEPDVYQAPTIQAYLGPALDVLGVLPVAVYTSQSEDESSGFLYKGMDTLMSDFGGVSRHWFPGDLGFDGFDNATEPDFRASEQECSAQESTFQRRINEDQNLSYSQPELPSDFDTFPTLFGHGVYREYRNGDSEVPIRVWNNASAQLFRVDIGDCIEGDFLYSYIINQSGAWFLNLRSKSIINDTISDSSESGYSSAMMLLSNGMRLIRVLNRWFRSMFETPLNTQSLRTVLSGAESYSATPLGSSEEEINYQRLRQGLDGAYSPGKLAYFGAYQVLYHDYIEDSDNSTVLDLLGGFVSLYFAHPSEGETSDSGTGWRTRDLPVIKYYMSQSESKKYSNSLGLLVGIDFISNGSSESNYQRKDTGFSRLWLTNVSDKNFMQYYGRSDHDYHSRYDWRQWGEVEGALQTCLKSGSMDIVIAVLVGVAAVAVLGVVILLCSICGSRFCCRIEHTSEEDADFPALSPAGVSDQLGNTRSREAIMKESISQRRIQRTKKKNDSGFDYIRME